MSDVFHDLQEWMEQRAAIERYFAGTFWFVLSPLVESDLADALQLDSHHLPGTSTPCQATKISEVSRTGKKSEVVFWLLPFQKQQLHLLFSLAKPWWALKLAYKLLGRARGKAHLFPISQNLVRLCARLTPRHTFEETRVVRGVSYPSKPSEGGAEISLRPGNATHFFGKVDDERRVLKLTRMQVPVGNDKLCEFTVSRVGYVSFHSGDLAPLINMIRGPLTDHMTKSARPFEEAKGRFVRLRFREPIFADQANYRAVLEGLARLPRTTIALLHSNPYFHAALTNYEDGGEFDVFITSPSSIHIQGRDEASAASYVRLHSNLEEVFREADVAIDEPAKFRLRDLLEGRV